MNSNTSSNGPALAGPLLSPVVVNLCLVNDTIHPRPLNTVYRVSMTIANLSNWFSVWISNPNQSSDQLTCLTVDERCSKTFTRDIPLCVSDRNLWSLQSFEPSPPSSPKKPSLVCSKYTAQSSSVCMRTDLSNANQTVLVFLIPRDQNRPAPNGGDLEVNILIVNGSRSPDEFDADSPYCSFKKAKPLCVQAKLHIPYTGPVTVNGFSQSSIYTKQPSPCLTDTHCNPGFVCSQPGSQVSSDLQSLWSCVRPTCSSTESNPCSGHGTCSMNVCTCDPGYFRADCSLYSPPSPPSPPTSHFTWKAEYGLWIIVSVALLTFIAVALMV